MKKVSKLEEVIQQAWAEPNLQKAKDLVAGHISESKIKSKDDILNNLTSISSKSRLDTYLANSLLYFEGMKLS